MKAIYSVRLLGGLCSQAALVVLLGGTGCNGSKQTATVSGTVQYRGAPVPGGSVNFLSKTGTAAQAKIDDSGSYTIEGPLEAGEYKVYITPPLPEPHAPGSPPTRPVKFDVPAKYRDAITSGVTTTVAAGKNVVPVDLKD